MKCHVCTNDVGDAHQCKFCKNKVNLICGNPEGDEGLGQSFICFNCSKKGFYLTSILHIIHLFQASLFKCSFYLLKLLNHRNENEYIQTFLHMQFSITFSIGSQKLLIT